MKYNKEHSLFISTVCTLVLSSCLMANPTVKPEMQISIPTSSTTQSRTIAPSPTLTESGSTNIIEENLPPSVGGIHLHYPVQPQWLDAVIQSGARWTRLDVFFWDKIEPVKLNPPEYDWSQVDEKSLIRLADSGIQLIAGILYTPDWAQKYPGIACGPIAQPELDRFADFMAALVSRYSQPPFSIRYWEIGNEPDIDRTLVSPRSGFGCWGEAEDPYYGGSYYAQVLQQTYPRVKKADPQAQLLPGGLLLNCDPTHPPLDATGQPGNCTTGRFLEGILQAGGGAYMDGINFHAYDYYNNQLGQYGNPNWYSDWQTTGPVWISKLSYLRNLLKETGLQELPLYLTELAIICGRDGSEEYCQTQDMEQTKAIYAVQSLAIGKAENLETVIWFGIEGWRASGMLQRGAPLPIYHAFSFFESKISDAEVVQSVQEFPGVSGYSFNNEGQEIWVLWSSDGKIHQIDSSRIPNTIYNVEGKEILPVSSRIDVSISPIYIFW